MVFVGTESVIAIISYVLAAYTLTVWCMKIPSIVRFVKTFKNENKYARRWLEDARLRVNVSLYGSLAWNSLYGIFQLWLGLYHHTFWFSSIGAYYICLAVMRFFLVRHTRNYAPGEKIETELKKYRFSGIVLLIMNLALTLIIFFMVYWNRTFEHHMITAIAMAAYTFTTLTTAIISVIKYRKYNSPVFSASKAIGLAAALVSLLTLESTMLTTFKDRTMTDTAQKWMLGATGGVISALIVATAIYMIAVGTKKLKKLKTEVKNG
jgi:MFS family permease